MLADLGPNVAADVVAGAFLTVLGTGMMWIRKQLKDVGQMTRDWRGKPERPGISDGIPGVMQRLYTQDRQFHEVMDHLGRQDSTLEMIKAEIEYNHGGSIKDAVHRTDEAVATLSNDVRAIQKTLDKK